MKLSNRILKACESGQHRMVSEYTDGKDYENARLTPLIQALAKVAEAANISALRYYEEDRLALASLMSAQVDALAALDETLKQMENV